MDTKIPVDSVLRYPNNFDSCALYIHYSNSHLTISKITLI